MRGLLDILESSWINSVMQDQFGRKCKARTLSVENEDTRLYTTSTPTPANNSAVFKSWCLLKTTWNDFIFEFQFLCFLISAFYNFLQVVLTGSSGMFRRDCLAVGFPGCSRPWDPRDPRSKGRTQTQIKHQDHQDHQDQDSPRESRPSRDFMAVSDIVRYSQIYQA